MITQTIGKKIQVITYEGIRWDVSWKWKENKY